MIAHSLEAQVPEGLPGAAHVLSSSTSSASSVDEAAASAPPPGEVEGLRMRPGLAMSQDARNWARIEGDHHTGALFDVGQPGEWDELFIGSPQVRSGRVWCPGRGGAERPACCCCVAAT